MVRQFTIQDSAAPILRNNKLELLGGVLVFPMSRKCGRYKTFGISGCHDPLTGLINRSAFETILQGCSEKIGDDGWTRVCWCSRFGSFQTSE